MAHYVQIFKTNKWGKKVRILWNDQQHLRGAAGSKLAVEEYTTVVMSSAKKQNTALSKLCI